LFEEKVGVDTYINTEATGNPSVETFFKSFVAVNSSKIILIIDDSNYVLSANQAKELLPKNISCEIYSARSIVNSFYLCTIVNYSQTYMKNKRDL
jgi:dihydroxyacetone kinase-like predicted kinase